MNIILIITRQIRSHNMHIVVAACLLHSLYFINCIRYPFHSFILHSFFYVFILNVILSSYCSTHVHWNTFPSVIHSTQCSLHVVHIKVFYVFNKPLLFYSECHLGLCHFELYIRLSSSLKFAKWKQSVDDYYFTSKSTNSI